MLLNSPEGNSEGRSLGSLRSQWFYFGHLNNTHEPRRCLMPGGDLFLQGIAGLVGESIAGYLL